MNCVLHPCLRLATPALLPMQAAGAGCIRQRGSLPACRGCSGTRPAATGHLPGTVGRGAPLAAAAWRAGREGACPHKHCGGTCSGRLARGGCTGRPPGGAAAVDAAAACNVRGGRRGGGAVGGAGGGAAAAGRRCGHRRCAAAAGGGAAGVRPAGAAHPAARPAGGGSQRPPAGAPGTAAAVGGRGGRRGGGAAGAGGRPALLCHRAPVPVCWAAIHRW